MNPLKLALPLLLCHAASAATFPITSTFDNGQTEGWIAMNTGENPLVLLPIDAGSPGEDTGGEPGEYTPAGPAPSAGLLSFYDIDAGEWGFVNTDKFSGDLSAAFGGTLSFTQRWDTLQTGPYPTENLSANVVFRGLDSANKPIGIVNFNPVVPTRDTPHPFSKPINESGGWYWVDESTPFAPPDLTLATDAQIKQVLSNVTFLFILGEFFTGDDRGYLDNVTLTAPTILALTATRLAGGTVALQVTGVAGKGRVVIQASDDLAQWKEIHSVVPTGGVINFVDLEAPTHPRRFYRAGPRT